MKNLNIKITVQKIKNFSVAKLSILFAWSRIQWKWLTDWVNLKIDLFFEWLVFQTFALVDDVLESIYNIPLILRNLLQSIFYYKKAFFYYRVYILRPCIKKIQTLLHKVLIILQTLKRLLEKELKRQYMIVNKQWLFIYNHVVKATEKEAALIEKQKELLEQRQKAPSLWVLKLDFLAFFSILNRIISVLLIVFVFFFLAFIFIYDLKFKITNIIMFYLYFCICTMLFVHIGFSYFKQALLFDNFRHLVSNNISHIKKFYIIIYVILFLISFYYVSTYIVLGHDMQILYFTCKSLHYNYHFDQILICESAKDANLYKLALYLVILYFIISFLTKYIYICKVVVNCANLLDIAIRCVCFSLTFIFVTKIYWKHNVHLFIFRYANKDLITFISYDAHNNVKRRVVFDPSIQKQYKGLIALIDSIPQITYPIMYRAFSLNDGILTCSPKQFTKFMEDVYLYIGVRTYRLLYLSFKKPHLFTRSFLKINN